jgi:hypothetical protein
LFAVEVDGDRRKEVEGVRVRAPEGERGEKRERKEKRRS